MSDIKTLVPTCIIKINGSRLDKEQEAAVIGLVLDERIDAPSRLTITLADTLHKIKDDDNFYIGSQIKLALGYKDDIADIFEGEVTGMSAHYRAQAGHIVIIKVQSYLHRLYRVKKTRSFNQMTDKDIINELTSAAQLTAETDSLPVKHLFTLQKDATDFDFIRQIARRNGCSLWVEGKKLFCKRLILNAGEDAVLEWGKTLKEFDIRTDSLPLVTEVEVRGWDNKQLSAVVGKAGLSDLEDDVGGRQVQKNFGDAKTVIIDDLVAEQERADEYARDLITENARRYILAGGKTEGMTKIRAGSIIKLTGMGKQFSRKYFVLRALHCLDSLKGYTTHFDVIPCLGSGNTGKAEAGDNQKETQGSTAPAGQTAPAGGASEQPKQTKNSQPRFLQLQWQQANQQIDKAYLDDTVTIYAEAQDLDEGAWVRIRIYEKNYQSENDYYAALSTQVKDGKITQEWQTTYAGNVYDPEKINAEKGKEYPLTDYVFVLDTSAQERVTSEQSPALTVKKLKQLEVILHIDTDNPYAQDDLLILQDEGGSEVARLAVKDMVEEQENWVRAKFVDVDIEKKYTLLYDYGENEQHKQIVVFSKMTAEELMSEQQQFTEELTSE